MLLIPPNRPARGFRLAGLPLLRSALLAALLSLGLADQAAASISVSPAAVYLDHRTRSGTITLYNPGSRPAEVEIGFAFGYPVSDTLGEVTVPLSATAPAGEPSALGWVRAFPRRLILQPGQEQVVRILAQPPAELPAGEYWARVMVTARGGQPPIEQREGDVSVQLDIETTIVSSVVYRNGNVSTGVEVTGASATETPEGIALLMDLQRSGSAAFLGRIRAELLDGTGRVVSEAMEEVAVYHQLRRRVLLPHPEGGAGAYTVRYTIDTERPDLPPGGPLPVAPKQGTTAVARR